MEALTRDEQLAADPRYLALRERLDRLIAELEDSGDPEVAVSIRDLLRSSAAETSVAAILAYLDSGADLATGGEFVVGTSAFLDSSPTLRVLFLDALGEIDAKLAADYSEKIFADSNAADEWAVALRNYMAGQQLRERQAALADDFLTARIEEALNRVEWREEPTVGFLHTLDFAVLAPDRASMAALADLSASGSGAVHPAVRRVANGQLWRLAHRDLVDTVTLLGETGSLGQLDFQQRAILHAHADVRVAGERAVVENYLSGDLAQSELARFAEVFPYFGLEVTNHLATQNHQVDMQDDAEAVIEAYLVVRQWREENAFPDKEPALARIEARLERLARSIERGLRPNEG